MSGLLFGDISSMPRYVKQAFIDTGTIHIVAISGYNITILISFLLMLGPYVYIPRRLMWFVAVPTIIAFVTLTGAESSAVRAAIMGLIAALAGETGRLSDVRRVLTVAGFIMLLVNPYLLVFDVGFQLSFLATLGLVYITPRLDEFVKKGVLSIQKKTPLLLIQRMATTTMGATIAVSGVVFFTFGQFSLLSPLVNVLILWTIPFAMALGFGSIVASSLWQPAGEIFGWCSWLVLEYVIRVVQWFG
jgi:competence protein ComEC